jgi:hypothetical protein
MKQRRTVSSLAVLTALAALGARPASCQVPVGPEFQVNSYTTSEQFQYRSLSADPAGNFVVVWWSEGQDGSGRGLFGQRYDAAGTPRGVEFQVNSYTTADQGFPWVASDAAGNFVVVWERGQQPGSGYTIFGQRYDATGTAQGVEFQVNSYTTFSNHVPSVASDAAGNFVVVWSREFPAGLFGRRFDATGTPQGVDFLVTMSGSPFPPSVASDATGNFVVVWQSSGPDGSGRGVFGQRYDATGTAQGVEFQVNSYTTSDQGYPKVSSDAAGDFVVVWYSRGQDGSLTGIFGRRYDATGTAQGVEFQVNSYTTSYQFNPNVASDAIGNFVVVWNSYGQDGDSSGVFGQRFDPDLIFADGFESGDVAAWSSAEAGGGDLSASPASAMAGTATGLEAVVNDTGGLYVRDDSPGGEGRYRARFYFDPNGFDPGEAQGHRRTRIFIAFDDSPVKRHIAVVLRRLSGQYALQARVRVDDNSQVDTGFFDVTDAPHFVELDWRQATDAVSNDGSFEMSIDGVSVSALAGLSNSLRSVDLARLGPQSLKGGAAGTLYLDEFESRRLRTIGP